MRKEVLFVGILLAASFLSTDAFATNPNETNSVSDESNQTVKADLEMAIAKGDYRFAAIKTGGETVGEDVPGIDMSYFDKELKDKYGLRVIADLSGDVINEEWHMKQATRLHFSKYAEEYNRLLLEKIREKEKSPSE